MKEQYIKIENPTKKKIEYAYQMFTKPALSAIGTVIMRGMTVVEYRINWGYRFVESFPCW